MDGAEAPPPFIRGIHHDCYGIQLDDYKEERYYLDRPYPANQAQFKALMDELEENSITPRTPICWTLRK